MFFFLSNCFFCVKNMCSSLTKNAGYLGKGIALVKYTGARGKSGSNDANAEYIASLRKIMDDNNVNYQMAELGKVDVGGGGTIAYILSLYGRATEAFRLSD